MANQPGVNVTGAATNIVEGISEGTEIVVQNIGPRDVRLFEGRAEDRERSKPNLIRGTPFFDAACYTVERDPIWAWTNDGETSSLAVTTDA